MFVQQLFSNSSKVKMLYLGFVSGFVVESRVTDLGVLVGSGFLSESLLGKKSGPDPFLKKRTEERGQILFWIRSEYPDSNVPLETVQHRDFLSIYI